MEKIYKPENFSATEPLDLNKYFNEYQEECNLQSFDTKSIMEQRLQVLKSEFKLPHLDFDDIKTMEEQCTIGKLQLKHEHPKLPIKTIPKNYVIPYVHELTHEAKMLETAKSKEVFNSMKSELQLELKIFGLWLEDKEDLNDIKDLEPGSTFIHKISVHIPFNTMSGNRLTPDSIRVQYEIEVLGTNTLLDLANAIKCVSDNFIVREVESPQVDLSELLNAKEKYPSRCLFIENVFYNDMSHPDTIDYSAVVRKWALEKDLGNFKCESMEATTFNDIKPRLGFGYVYIHQGNCEHIISFSDSRLIQSSDCLMSAKYPKIVSLKRQTNHLCCICSESHSTWMVVNSDRLPVEKAFLCAKCCDAYLYCDGKKLGSFRLYPYHNGTIIPLQEDRVEDEIEVVPTD